MMPPPSAWRELPRIPIPRTPVNKGKEKGPIARSWHHHSPLQAGELLFQKRVVGCASFLTFKPLQVARNPRVMAFTFKAPDDIRPKEVLELLLGALEVHTRLPLPSLLMAVLPVGQLPQLLAGFGIGDNP